MDEKISDLLERRASREKILARFKPWLIFATGLVCGYFWRWLTWSR